MRNVFLAGVAIVSLALPASAADLTRKAPPAPIPMAMVPYSWSGLYVGVEGAGSFGRSVDNYIGSGATSAFDVSGAMGGGTIGYNYQVGAFVFGLEADLSGGAMTGSTPCINPAFTCTTKSTWLATGRGRAGYAIDRLLLFVTGGVADADVAAQVSSTGTGSNTETYSRSGYALGAGAEYALTQNWSMKAEYLYVGLSNHSYFLTNPAPTYALSRNVPYNENLVRVGVNYKF